jgi:hypothetical protein
MPNLDWPTFGNALWMVNDRLGIRPEWQLQVMDLESALDPSSMNSGGCVGLNQLCPSTYPRYVSAPVSDYRRWPASAQLSGPVFAYWRDALAYGPINSAARLMVAQLGQRLLSTAVSPNDTVLAAPSPEYAANSGLDLNKNGRITVQDLADVLAQRSRSPAVQEAIVRAYALRPNEIPGEDFSFATVNPPITSRAGIVAATVGVIAVVAAATFGAIKWFNRPPPELEPLPYYPSPYYRRRPF